VARYVLFVYRLPIRCAKPPRRGMRVFPYRLCPESTYEYHAPVFGPPW
jgi:hypothetical protein